MLAGIGSDNVRAVGIVFAGVEAAGLAGWAAAGSWQAGHSGALIAAAADFHRSVDHARQGRAVS